MRCQLQLASCFKTNCCALIASGVFLCSSSCANNGRLSVNTHTHTHTHTITIIASAPCRQSELCRDGIRIEVAQPARSGVDVDSYAGGHSSATQNAALEFLQGHLHGKRVARVGAAGVRARVSGRKLQRGLAVGGFAKKPM